jgi:hypothetical protein
VPGSKEEALRDTVRNVSWSTPSASGRGGCKALINARIVPSLWTNSSYTCSEDVLGSEG